MASTQTSKRDGTVRRARVESAGKLPTGMPSGNSIASQSPERLDDEQAVGTLLVSEHLARYIWASQLTVGAKVLDAGCGTGYGSVRLTRHGGAAEVIAIDVSEEAVAVAQERHASAGVSFAVGDVHALEFDDDSFDVVVCFEVIEHIEQRDLAVREFRRVLRPGGVLVISSPNRNVYPPGNPHHVYEYTPEELQSELRARFNEVALYSQHAWLASSIAPSTHFESHESESINVVNIPGNKSSGEVYTVALASDTSFQTVSALMTVGAPFEVLWWEQQLAATSEQLGDALRRAEIEKRDADQAKAENVASGNALIDAESEVARLATQVAEMEILVDNLRSQANRDAIQFDHLTERLTRAERTITDMDSSISWKITTPLRVMARLLRGLLQSG